MLKQLYQLQELETAERALAQERVSSAEFKQLRSLRASFDVQKEQYAQEQAAIARLEKKLSACNTRVADLEHRLEKEQQSVYDGSVTNAKELASRKAQIGTLREKLESAQADRLQQQEQLMSRQEAAAAQRSALTELQSDFAAVRDVFTRQQAGRDQAAAELAERKEQLLSEIDSAELEWFESQRARFKGTPVARLEANGACSGCHTLVTPAAHKRALSGSKTYCEHCGRLLFIDN